MNLKEQDHQPQDLEYTKPKLAGAHWSEQKQKWSASIYINKKTKHLGSFDSMEEAHEAYKLAGGGARLKEKAEPQASLAILAMEAEIEFGPKVRAIPLSSGKITIVDAEDYDRLATHKWSAYLSPYADLIGSWYAMRRGFKNGKRVTIYMAREIMNAPDGVEVDHVRTKETLDNRKENLRFATHNNNQHNRKKSSNNKSGFKGVFYDKRLHKNPWRACIMINKKQIHLGCFSTAEEASEAYKKAAHELHGEFANY